jgi:hypothetical protein
MLDSLSSNTAVLRATAAIGLSNADALCAGPRVEHRRDPESIRDYLDLSASFDLGKGLSMRAGANNLLRQEPADLRVVAKLRVGLQRQHVRVGLTTCWVVTCSRRSPLSF